MKRVRFAEPEEFIADCGVVFDHALSDCLEEEEPRGNDDVRRCVNLFSEKTKKTFCFHILKAYVLVKTSASSRSKRKLLVFFRHLEIIKKDDEESFVRLLSTCPEACTKEHFDGYSALHVAVREGICFPASECTFDSSRQKRYRKTLLQVLSE